MPCSTTAYSEYGKPVLCVGSNGNGWGIGYGPRYYDEGAETIDMYLTFWLLGVSSALSQAENWWSWVNANLYDTNSSSGSFYKYALEWTTFECEAGGFDQIISRLYYYDPAIPDVSNLLTDLETRFLSQGWSSPQWATSNYVVQHAVGNSQERLENTIMSWAALFGLYADMTSNMQSQLQGLLDGSAGPAPAWNLLLQSELYDNSTGMFRMLSTGSVNVDATADAAVLMMLLSTVPVTGALAVPMEDCVYEDINNVIDGGISNINLATKTVTVSVDKAGTFLSTFGTDIIQYDLGSPGVWQLNFTSDWNTIASAELLSSLPNSRIYLETANASPINASIDSYSTITPFGLVYVKYGDNQTFTYSADDGYVVSQVLVDNVSVPITGSYTFTNVEGAHSISVTSSPASTPTPTPSPTPTLTPTPTPTPSPTPTPTPPTNSKCNSNANPKLDTDSLTNPFPVSFTNANPNVKSNPVAYQDSIRC